MSTEADPPAAMDTGQQHNEDVPKTQPQNEPVQSPQAKTYRQVAAAHIDTLNEINHQLPKMLRYFATALTQLTNNPIHDHDQEGQPDTLEARQAAFRKYAIYIGMSVNLVREELTQQINDLELYKVIPKSHPKYTVAKRQGDKSDKEIVDPEQSTKNGGYGEFDVGVLNARARSDQVGQEDVLDRVKGLLEDLMKRGKEDANEEDMMVDG